MSIQNDALQKHSIGISHTHNPRTKVAQPSCLAAAERFDLFIYWNSDSKNRQTRAGHVV